MTDIDSEGWVDYDTLSVEERTREWYKVCGLTPEKLALLEEARAQWAREHPPFHTIPRTYVPDEELERPPLLHRGIAFTDEQARAYAQKHGITESRYEFNDVDPDPEQTLALRVVCHLAETIRHTLELRIPISNEYPWVMEFFSNYTVEELPDDFDIHTERKLVKIIQELMDTKEVSMWWWDRVQCSEPSGWPPSSIFPEELVPPEVEDEVEDEEGEDDSESEDVPSAKSKSE